ncbi:MAG: hypothetical protein ACK4ZI_19425 [Microcystis sp.]|uniref:hypothetical protein n=1 Tax=Microcystis sp. TaxID=1127 RepID=UPI0022C596A1|nr:hypothetical protein [Microcystis sp. LE19-338.1B]
MRFQSVRGIGGQGGALPGHHRGKQGSVPRPVGRSRPFNSQGETGLRHPTIALG